jgi:hypothetical protein
LNTFLCLSLGQVDSRLRSRPAVAWVPERVIKSVINSVIPKSLKSLGHLALDYGSAESAPQDDTRLPPLMSDVDVPQASPAPSSDALDSETEDERPDSLDLQDDHKPVSSTVRPLVEQLRQINTRLSALELAHASSSASTRKGPVSGVSTSWIWRSLGLGRDPGGDGHVSPRDILLSSSVLSISAGAIAAALAYGVLSRWERVRRG